MNLSLPLYVHVEHFKPEGVETFRLLAQSHFLVDDRVNVEHWRAQLEYYFPSKESRQTPIVIDAESIMPTTRQYKQMIAVARELGFTKIGIYVWYDNKEAAAARRDFWKALVALADFVYMGIHHDENAERVHPEMVTWVKYARSFNKQFMCSHMAWTTATATKKGEAKNLQWLQKELEFCVSLGAIPALFIPKEGKETFTDWEPFCAAAIEAGKAAARQ